MRSPDRMTETPLVEGIYEAVLEPDGWGNVLQQAMVLGRASSAALYVQDLATRKPDLAVSIGVTAEREQWSKFYDYYVFRNPVRIANLAAPVGEPTASNLLLPDAQFEALEYHRDFQSRVGCFYELAMHVVRDEQVLACFSIHRSRAEGGFTGRDLAAVKHLHPHLRRAMLLRRRLGDQAAATRSLERVFHALAAAVCLVSGSGRVLFMNAAAEQIVAAGTALRVKDGRLLPAQPAREAEWSRWLAAGSAGPEAPASDGRLVLRDRGGTPVLHVWASPFRVPAERPDIRGAKTCIALFLNRPGAPVAVSAQRLREFFGLTPAEGRALHGLVNGKTPGEIAADAGLSPDTIRVQIKAIFEKLEVHRQAELMQRVLMSPAVMVAEPGAGRLNPPAGPDTRSRPRGGLGSSGIPGTGGRRVRRRCTCGRNL